MKIKCTEDYKCFNKKEIIILFRASTKEKKLEVPGKCFGSPNFWRPNNWITNPYPQSNYKRASESV